MRFDPDVNSIHKESKTIPKNPKGSRSIPKDYEGLRGIIAKMVSKLWDLTQMQTQFIKNPEGSLKIPNIYEGLSTTVSINCKNWIKMQIQIKKNPEGYQRIMRDHEGLWCKLKSQRILKASQSIPKDHDPQFQPIAKLDQDAIPNQKESQTIPKDHQGLRYKLKSQRIPKEPNRSRRTVRDHHPQVQPIA